MSQIVYRANLSAKSFPFLSEQQGRSIIIPGADQNYKRNVVAKTDADADAGIPVLYYCHNVIPTAYGFSSIGYDKIGDAGGAVTSAFNSIVIARSNTISSTVPGPKYYFSPTPTGSHYALLVGQYSWKLINSSVPYTAGNAVSTATCQGITYIFFQQLGCYKYDSVGNQLIPVTLTALDPTKILGIAAFQGYLIAYDASSIYWSSTLDIDYTINTVDFTPSLVTGAGQLKPEGTRGPIKLVVPATFGLGIYTNSNAVSAIYSGNSRYPFNFKEIVSSGGCNSSDYVTYESNTNNQIAYTTAGFQMMSANQSQTLYPDLTDFIAGGVFEDFDETTNSFTQVNLSKSLLKKIVGIVDRYLIISYGINELTHAILYDMVQKRYGKLKITHVACFEYEYLDSTQVETPRRSIAFLKQDGTIYVANLSITNVNSDGVMLLGEFQYVRSRLVSMQEVQVENIHTGQNFNCYDYYSLNGTDKAWVQGYDVSVYGSGQRVFKFNKTAVNHSFLFVGGFSIDTLQLAFKPHGKR